MSYPSSPDYTAINFRGVARTLKSETRSGKVQVTTVGAQRWEFSASYNSLTRAQFAPVMAFVMSQGGEAGVFTITPPVISNARGSVSGTVSVNGAHTAGDNTIAVDGFSGTISAGDLVKFAGHSKVYMVVSDTTSGNDLTITPPLTQTVANDEQVIYDNVTFTVRLKNDVQEFSSTMYDSFDFEVDFVEVI